MKINKKILTTLVLFGLLSATGLATWFISVQSNTLTASVVSDGQGLIYITQDFTAISEIDTTNTSITLNQSLLIFNENGIMEMVLNISETRTDNINDSCSDYLTDITTTYYFNNVEVSTGDLVNVTSSENELLLVMDYKMSSCPQLFSSDVGFAEV